jgi:hypothetical protein
MREDLSSEKLEDRVRKMQLQLEKMIYTLTKVNRIIKVFFIPASSLNFH